MEPRIDITDRIFIRSSLRDCLNYIPTSREKHFILGRFLLDSRIFLKFIS